VDAHTRLLLLGSLPGERSLAEARYYAHPRNHFWPLVGQIIEQDFVGMDYPRRLAALIEAGIGLWDVVGSAVRPGSLDASIREPQANDLVALVDRLPQLAAVGFNGGKSASIGRAALAGRLGLALVPLPSSSPAYTLPFEAKKKEWLKLKPFLAAR